MSYQIVLSNLTTLVTLADGNLDTTTSLTLVGRNYAGYGQYIADNFVHLLENGASSLGLRPAHPLVGQLWFCTDNTTLNVFTGSVWFPFSTGVTSVIGMTGAISLQQLVSKGVAPLASPLFTGVPSGPTAPIGTNTTQLATTAFVTNQIGLLNTGVISVLAFTGVVTLANLTTLLAPLGSPSLTGVPTAPTAPTGTNTTQLATTAFVLAQVGALSSGVSSVLGYTGAVTLAEVTSPQGGLAPAYNAALSGIPTAPTAGVGTNTSQLATTAFVYAAQTSLLASNNTWTGSNTHTNAIILKNNIWLYGVTTKGTSIPLIGVDGSNYSVVWAGTSGLRVVNPSASINYILIDTNGNAVFSGGVSANGFDSAGGGQLRANYSSYGFMIRNDDTNTYLLLTAANNPAGDFNGLRPLWITNATGQVHIAGNGVSTWIGGELDVIGPINASGNVTANGARLRAAYGAYNSGDFNCAVILNDFGSSATWSADRGYAPGDNSGGYQILPNGLIMQWMAVSAPAGLSLHNFPLTFPHSVFNLIISYLAHDNPVGSVGADVANTGQFWAHNQNASGSNGCYMFAIGY